MVVHTPTKLDALRQTAERRAAGQQGSGDVPPSVLAAAQDAAGDIEPVLEGAGVVGDAADLLDAASLTDAAQVEHDFAAWDGVNPPGTRASIEDAETEEHIEVDVNVLRGGDSKLPNATNQSGGARDRVHREQGEDVRAGMAAPRSDAPNPFTPEWFEHLIGAAVTAAATAVATASSSAPRPSPRDAAGVAPRRLNDRKVPDFWEDRPEFWFRIFDAHLAHFSPSEKRCFDALLPLLTPAARSVVHSVIRTPGRAPYSQAREALLRHFGRTPRQLAREAREARSLGDKLPSEFLDHVMSLMPDVKTFYEIALLDALPANARIAALGHSDVRAMALAADAVVLESRAAAEVERPLASVAAVSSADGDLGQVLPPTVSAVGRASKPAQKSSLCSSHARWGKETYKCASPTTCKMRGVLKPRPASGNGKAGGQ